MIPSTTHRVLSWVVMLLVPVAVVLTAVRLMFSPLYRQFEYNAPGFPPDRYGFTTEERLYWSDFAVDYLLNDADISYLGDLRFEDGTPLYNERELSHMVDVKNTVRAALTVWMIAWLGLVALGVWAWLGGWWSTFARAVGRGGWLTVIALGTIILLVAISFGVVFVAFHNVFFAPGTWTFFYSDTLIRLFPERFWRDIFVIVGILSVTGGLLLAFLFPRLANKRR